MPPSPLYTTNNNIYFRKMQVMLKINIFLSSTTFFFRGVKLQRGLGRGWLAATTQRHSPPFHRSNAHMGFQLASLIFLLRVTRSVRCHVYFAWRARPFLFACLNQCVASCSFHGGRVRPVKACAIHYGNKQALPLKASLTTPTHFIRHAPFLFVWVETTT